VELMSATKELFPAFKNPVAVDRPLIAYAFLAQATHVQGDLLSGLAPIFRPIAKERAGKAFDSKEFAAAVSTLYGIKISPWAVDDLAPRLEKAGLLSKLPLGTKAEQYVYQQINGNYEAVDESSIRLVVRRFIDYSTPLLSAKGIAADEGKLEKFFLDQLISLDFHATLLRPSSVVKDDPTSGRPRLSLAKKSAATPSDEESLSERSKLNVLCAGFIVGLYREDRPLYEQVIKIATGALLSEVILNVQDPGKTASLLTLKLVLDAPFLMSLLNLSSEDSFFYSKELYNLLSEKGAVFEVFRHSVDEIISNLKGVRAGHQAGVGYGPTARRLRDATFAKYLDSTLGSIEDVIKRNKIRIIDVPDSVAAFQYFTDADEKDFYRSLGSFQNSLAQNRDAKSIAGTVRLRRGQTARMSHVYQAQYIFVSENQFVVDCARSFSLKKQIIKEGEVPPAVTDRYLAGLAWVLFGGKADEITQYQLLANCTAALEVRSDVQEKMLSFLSRIDGSMAEQFRAIMTTERGGQHLMQLTFGDPLLIKSTDDAEKILESLSAAFEKKHKDAADLRVAEAIAEADRRNLAQLEQVRSELQGLAEAAEEAREKEAERAREAATEAFIAKKDQESTQKELAQLTRQFTEDREARARVDEAAITRFVTEAGRYASRLRNEITVLISALAGFVAVYGTDFFASLESWGAIGIFIITMVLTCIGFWRIPDRWLEPLVSAAVRRDFNKKCAARGVENAVKRFSIRLTEGSLSRKSDDNAPLSSSTSEGRT